DAAEQDAVLDRVFQDSPDSDNLLAAVVLQATAADVRAVLSNGDQIQVNGDGLKFAARALTDKAPAAQRIRRGAVIRVIRDEKGFSPATIINDAPFFVPAAQAGGEDWEPKNYDGKFDGPMRLRTALAKSKNLVTVRVLQAIGPQYAQDYIGRFGFDPKLHPAY